MFTDSLEGSAVLSLIAYKILTRSYMARRLVRYIAIARRYLKALLKIPTIQIYEYAYLAAQNSSLGNNFAPYVD